MSKLSDDSSPSYLADRFVHKMAMNKNSTMRRSMETVIKTIKKPGSRIGECNGGKGDGDNGIRGGKKIGDDILLTVIQLEINFVNVIKFRESDF